MKRSFWGFCLLAFISLTTVSCRTEVYCYIVKFKLFPPSVVEVGSDFVDAKFFDVNGNKKTISDYSGKGKNLLLTFWDSGCGYTEDYLSLMKVVSEKYNENLTLVSISINSETEWKKALSTYDIPWIHIRDPKKWCGVATKYGADGVPYYVIISPDGKVVDKWFGFSELKEKVSEHIK